MGAPWFWQQNGVTERKSRTLLDIINFMLIYFGLHKIYGVKHRIQHGLYLIGYLK